MWAVQLIIFSVCQIMKPEREGRVLVLIIISKEERPLTLRTYNKNYTQNLYIGDLSYEHKQGFVLFLIPWTLQRAFEINR